MKGSKTSIKIPSKVIIPIIAIIIGAIFFYIGVFQYGFWDSEASKPTKGFFPVIIATALIGLSILALVQGIKSEKVEFNFKNWLVPLGLLAIIASSYIFGLVLSIAAYIVIWLKVYEKQTWKTTIITLAVAMFIVVGCFQLWLGIDFPLGIIFDLILG